MDLGKVKINGFLDVNPLLRIRIRDAAVADTFDKTIRSCHVMREEDAVERDDGAGWTSRFCMIFILLDLSPLSPSFPLSSSRLLSFSFSHTHVHALSRCLRSMCRDTYPVDVSID